MFNNPRYLTAGVDERIPIELQIWIWERIDSLSIEKDYLQVFKIKRLGENKVEIEHKQEQPEYSKKYNMGLNLKDITIFVIDDKTHSTMLLASEY